MYSPKDDTYKLLISYIRLGGNAPLKTEGYIHGNLLAAVDAPSTRETPVNRVINY